MNPDSLRFKGIGGFFFGLVSLVSLWGEVLVRHRFGERYLSYPRIIISILLLFAPVLITSLVFYARTGYFTLGQFVNPYLFRDIARNPIMILGNLGLILNTIIIIMFFTHRGAIARRNRTGEQWHSYSQGESRFRFGKNHPWQIKQEIEPRLFVGIGLICAILPFVRVFGISLMFIGFAILLKEGIYAAQLRERYLDAVDARIEAEAMNSLVEEGWEQTLGTAPEQLVSQKGFDVIVPKDPESLKVFMNKSAAQNPLITQRLAAAKAKPHKAVRSSPSDGSRPSAPRDETLSAESRPPDSH